MKTARIILFLVYAFFCVLMLNITLQYIPIRLDAAFLGIKQDVVFMLHYQWAFFVHAFAAIVTLLAGFTQFSTSFRLRLPQWHRYLGWLYAGNVLLLAGPSGFVIGLYANGGWTSQLGFCLLAVLWIMFTALSIVRVRQGNIAAHRQWMIRSFALTLSAITLRAWKYVLVALFEPRPMDVYRIVAWLGWVFNLMVAEWIIRQPRSKKIISFFLNKTQPR